MVINKLLKYLFLSTLLIKFGCNCRKNQDNKTKNPLSETDKKKFSKSAIINPKFDKELLLGTWGESHDSQSCEFEIDENTFHICDYDGDGKRKYLVNGDSIFINNPTLVFKGKILKINKDSLIIQWQKNKKPEVLLRW